jgi:hypothetical protein
VQSQHACILRLNRGPPRGRVSCASSKRPPSLTFHIYITHQPFFPASPKILDPTHEVQHPVHSHGHPRRRRRLHPPQHRHLRNRHVLDARGDHRQDEVAGPAHDMLLQRGHRRDVAPRLQRVRQERPRARAARLARGALSRHPAAQRAQSDQGAHRPRGLQGLRRHRARQRRYVPLPHSPPSPVHLTNYRLYPAQTSTPTTTASPHPSSPQTLSPTSRRSPPTPAARACRSG